MLGKLLNIWSTVAYVQIWETRLRVGVVGSSLYFDEQPLIAIQSLVSGEQTILAIGNEANVASCEPNAKVVNPFSHPRTVFCDFNNAEKLLRRAISKVHKDSFWQLGLRLIIQPMEKMEGGLTQIEIRAFRELAYGAGAREVKVHIGDELNMSIPRLWESVRSVDEI